MRARTSLCNADEQRDAHREDLPLRRVPTFCRICEPSCGLLAEVRGDRLVQLLPDKSHPVTRGFACHKGLAFAQVHDDPDRLDVPLRRHAGGFEAISWPLATTEIAARLAAIGKRHGGRSIAAYFGNPTAFNTLAPGALSGLLRKLGAERIFNSGTQDCANKFAGSEAVYGTSTLHPVPDFAHTHYALIFGANPRVSHMSFMSIADPIEVLRKARRRGARIRFINPRRIESAMAATGEVVQIKPDSDLYFMAALLHEIDAIDGFDAAVLARHGRHVAELRAFIAPYSAATVADVVGIDATTIRTIAHEFARADSACVHMSTGVNMGRQGTLCYWLLQMLSFTTGNLDRRGGNLYAEGFYPAARSGRIDPGAALCKPSPYGELRKIRGALPGNLLADMIESDPEPIRALIVIAGNPLLSIGGEARLRRALRRLELLVVLDLYRNATGELAHYLLPCTDMLERPDLNICGLGMQHEPFVQYTDAVVAPKHQRREEWWIAAQIEQALGVGTSVEPPPDPGARLDHMLARSHLSINALKRLPSQTAVLPPPRTGRFYGEQVQTADGRVDCCPPLFTAALADAQRIFAELRCEPPHQLKLISLRTPYMQNSWLHNLEALKRPGQQDNPLHMSAADAQRLGLSDGDAVSVRSRHGRMVVRLRIDQTLRSGVVAMSHGWGHARAAGLRVARRHPGQNVNALLPSGPGSYDPLSNQAHMTGIAVEVAPA